MKQRLEKAFVKEYIKEDLVMSKLKKEGKGTLLEVLVELKKMMDSYKHGFDREALLEKYDSLMRDIIAEE